MTELGTLRRLLIAYVALSTTVEAQMITSTPTSASATAETSAAGGLPLCAVSLTANTSLNVQDELI
jgi:hypothetical protein